MIVLETVADDVPPRHGDAAQPALAVGMLGEALVHRLAPPDRRIGDGIEDRLDGVVFGDHAPICGGVLLRELGELVAGPVDVVVLRQVGAVRERNVHHDFRMNVFEPVVRKPELVAAQHRAVLDDHMGGSARIVLKAGKRQFLGHAVAADDGSSFQHQATVTRLREVGSRDKTVVPGPGDDDVETIRHRDVPLIQAHTRHLAGYAGTTSTASGSVARAARAACPAATRSAIVKCVCSARWHSCSCAPAPHCRAA
jgi:hypothetical protein